MVNIKVPATSANLGPGFDVLGLALSLYNDFSFDLSDDLNFINVDEKFSNENNLTYIAFKKVAEIIGYKKECTIKYNEINIPFCRGLGSSATLIVAGIVGANVLLKANLAKIEMLKLATEIEGHPDNVAPAIFGDLNISLFKDGKIFHQKTKINEKIKATVIIPDYEVSTEEARKIIKREVLLSSATENVANSIFLIKALENGDFDLLSNAIDDNFHVPYRKTLIKDYDKIKNICLNQGAKAFTISGSGSTMIVFSDDKNFSKKIRLDKSYQVLDLDIDKNGAYLS